MRESKRSIDIGLFIAVALASLVVDAGSDRFLAAVLGDRIAWVRTLHLVPLLFSAVLYVACGPGDSWKPPREGVKRGWLAIPIWAAMFGLVFAIHWFLRKDVSRTEVVIGVVDLMVTHLIAQELLFRGALVALANRLWPADSPADLGDVSFGTLAATSIVFALAQLQYQSSLAAAAPWWQVLRALVLGGFMCGLRGSLRSLWASALFHGFNNLMVGLR
jgi:membrane protease YdiL (CAAX protease family)